MAEAKISQATKQPPINLTLRRSPETNHAGRLRPAFHFELRLAGVLSR